jgi:glycosyltransferase involved in cell wall biosynthesis
MADGGPLLLIGIPSFRRPDGLRKLLHSLQGQKNVDALQVELFVADNDSVVSEARVVCAELAPTYRWPLACGIVERRGISAARNAILDQARARGADLLAMLDDDEIAAPDWLHEIVAAQERLAADVVGGPLYFDFDEEPSRAVRNSGLFETPDRPEGILPMIDATNNVLFSCAALSRAGWPSFDDSFGLTGGGDREFFTRLRKRGLRFAWSPLAVARETVPKTRSRPSWVLRRAFRVGNGDMRIVRMHYGLGGSAISLGKAAILLGSAPLCSVLLLSPSRRLWLMGKWSRSLGKIAAMFNRHYHEYARS